MNELKKFKQKVRWEFKISMHGYGKNIKEALTKALESTLSEVENNEIDFLAIQNYETIDIVESDTEE